MNSFERRVIDLSYKHKLSHIGSCITALPIIKNIYCVMEDRDVFVLSNGHAGLALYVVLESDGHGNAEELLLKHGVHPNLDLPHGISCSTGSLGHGIGMAAGMALADRTRRVYVLLSDGECAEGSVWEALRIASEQGLENLKVHVNANGYGATDAIPMGILAARLVQFFPVVVHRTNMDDWPYYLRGVQAHYHVLQKDEYDVL